MEIRELRVYLAVVEEGSISAAARRLHQSQSSVSETVAALERQLGVALLTRSRSGVTETSAGRLLTGGGRRLVRAHDRLRHEVAALDEGGPVRMGVPLELPAAFLPAVVATVGRTSPGVTLEVRHASTAAQWDALRHGDLDLGLVRELRPGEEFDSLLVSEERLGVVLLADRAAALAPPGASIPLDRLAGMAWNGFARSDAPSSYDSIAAVLRTHGVHIADTDDGRPRTVAVKLAEIADGRRFALALPDFPLGDDMEWRALTGDPLIRRTWAVWRADETAASLATVVRALDAERRVGAD